MELPYLDNLNKKLTPKTTKSFLIKTQGVCMDECDISNIDRELILNRILNNEKTETFVQKAIVSDDEIDDFFDKIEQEQPMFIDTENVEKQKKIVIKRKVDDDKPKDIVVITKKGRKVKPKTISTMKIEDIEINGKQIKKRLPISLDRYKPRVSPYYMNNRKLAIEKINQIFLKYKGDDKNIDNPNVDFQLMNHQKVVREYLNLYTPYRGLLLLHGLGSGKTCTSIAIAEGMKTDRQVIVMTPASLKKNFFSEIKKCADPLFRKNQYWEFISTNGQPELENILSSAMSLSKEFIQHNKGAWLVDKTKPSNFSKLDNKDQAVIDAQLNEMIRSKYKDINYNGLLISHINELTKDQTINPFDNSVVIIDEAHNFVSRIVNKIKSKQTNSISYILYELLLTATNARIVLLTGTPIINYPNEVGVLFNILRGHIKTWTFPCVVKTKQKVNKEAILEIFNKENFNTFDYVEYSGNKLTITRNPFGFINIKNTKKNNIEDQYAGVKLDETGNLTDEDFKKIVIKVLKKNDIDITEGAIQITNHTALPDNTDQFVDMFIDEDNIMLKQENLFKRRILGLTSYFKSAKEDLLPSYVLDENDNIFHLVVTDMSDLQFTEYQKIRKREADREKVSKKNAKKQQPGGEQLFKIASSYRIESRLCCNFVFPDPPGRPMPDKKDINEADIDALQNEEEGEEQSVDYKQRIQQAMNFLQENADDYLSEQKLIDYSPKFLEILQNIKNRDHVGLHLLYSQFRTLEGIGILKLVLETNGFAEFDIEKIGGSWELITDEANKDKPKFFLHTGTEDPDKKEILLNIYNSKWDEVPSNIVRQLKQIHENNFLGEIVKVMMITSSGAEGINLKNTRYVHIVEPYWNMARLQQVIGRARRLESHLDLPIELRTVQVFLYMSTLSEEQSTNDKNLELINRDKSKIDKKTPVTTDENLYDISRIKDNINEQIMKSIKETSIDCSLYSNSENLNCFSFGKIKSNQFGSVPDIKTDSQQKHDVKQKVLRGLVSVVDPKTNRKLAYNKELNEIYDFDDYKQALANKQTLQSIGRIVKVGRKNTIEYY